MTPGRSGPDPGPGGADEAPPRRWPGSASTPSAGLTDPEDYALLNGVFLAGTAALLLAARRREATGHDPIGWEEVPLLALAAFSLSQVIAKEKVATWLREPFVVETAEHRPSRPEGSGIRYAVGELLTCTRCLGAWSALGLTGLRTASPPAGRAATALFATAGTNSFLQAGFHLATARANRAAAEAAPIAGP